MKYQIIAPFLIGALFSCSLNKEVGPDLCPEKWQLVKMSGNVANVPPSTGSDMDWQEWYLLYPDYTFTKTRERNSSVIEASGVYRFKTLSDGKYLELTYKFENELIGNCTSEAIELLKLNAEDELIGTWWACDGPGLFYEKMEYHCPNMTTITKRLT